MSVTIRRKQTGSWFDHDDSRRLAATLNAKLVERMKGKRGLFLTLTYDRLPYESAQDLYRKAQNERHVREFISRLARYLTGHKGGLTGKWIRKMEWQDSSGEGWLHYHLVIDWPGFVPKIVLRSLWGHGFVDIKRTSRDRLKYFAKYMAKTGGVPGWLLMERRRSIKTVAVSPGFWAESRPTSESIKRPPPSVYVPLGVLLQHARQGTTVHCNHSGIARTLRIEPADAAKAIRDVGGDCESDGRGGILCNVHWTLALATLTKASQPDAEGGGLAALDLKQTSNPRKAEPPNWWNQYCLSLGVLEWSRAA